MKVALFLVIFFPYFVFAKWTIGIIDTGLDVANPYLSKYLWTNPRESGLDDDGKNKSTNNKDDDGNGFIDDVHGWSFVNNSSNFQDQHGHGTHIASIIIDNLEKLRNHADFEIVICQYFKNEDYQPWLLKNSNECFTYLSKIPVDIINYSGGGYGANQTEEQIIKSLQKKEIALVAAMGNQSLSIDDTPFFPASYKLDNIFSIGSADPNQNWSYFSNFSKKFDFISPGQNIFGFGLNQTKIKLSGTSQSTAHATSFLSHWMIEHNQKGLWSQTRKDLNNLRNTLILQSGSKKENPNFFSSDFLKRLKDFSSDAYGKASQLDDL